MPESVDQFVLQKIISEGSNTQEVSNLLRDTYIKAWVYHKLMACEDGKVLTQKSLVADLKANYKALVKSLPLSTREHFSERVTEGGGDSTYSKILQKISVSGYLRSKIKELVLEAVM